MEKLYFDFFFNQETLNIFTDASVKTLQDGTVLSCPGSICVVTDDKGNTYRLEEDFDERNVVIGSTNNDGEIRAILLGIYYAIKYKNKFNYINLFSDSNTCIQGISDWIFKWINNMKKGIMYNSSNKPVANQDNICSIINTIIENNININFYHQKGHVKNNDKGHDICFNDFLCTNGIEMSMEIDLIKCISFYNDYVDKQTKQTLNKFTNIYYNNESYKATFNFTLKKGEIDNYKELIKRRI